MSEHWNSYFCNVNGKLASIRVDLGVRPTVPVPNRPWLLWVWVYFKQPRTDGLSSDEEFDKLCALEDALQKAVESKRGAVLAGCITTDGHREFYFYGPSPEGFKERVKQIVGISNDYKFDCDTQRDPDWTQYLKVLYPSEEQRQVIENRSVQDVLRAKGDTLELPRDVRHWIYFRSEAEREAFRRTALELQYRIEFEPHSERTSFPFGLCIAKTQPVRSPEIDDAVIELFRLAKYHCGDYDGWETAVISTAPES
jgi:uncharacterized protein (TIGR01619 family)